MEGVSPVRRLILLGISAVAGLTIVACGSASTAGNTHPRNTTSAIANQSNSAPATRQAGSSHSGLSILTFDYLNGNSKYIEVYPDPGNEQWSKIGNGSFMTGDTATIICKANGRWVQSEAGEWPKRRSNVWYLVAKGGQQYWTTAVYA